MKKANNLRGKLRYVVFLLAASLIVSADQLTKIWIRSHPEGHLIVDTGFFRLVHINNTGAVFGLFQGHSFALAIFASVIIAVLLFYGFFIYRHFPFLDTILGRLALGLILGGAVGNLTDRIRMGEVIDFIDMGIGNYRWPVYNLADIYITIGMFVLIFINIFKSDDS